MYDTPGYRRSRWTSAHGLLWAHYTCRRARRPPVFPNYRQPHRPNQSDRSSACWPTPSNICARSMEANDSARGPCTPLVWVSLKGARVRRAYIAKPWVVLHFQRVFRAEIQGTWCCMQRRICVIIDHTSTRIKWLSFRLLGPYRNYMVCNRGFHVKGFYVRTSWYLVILGIHLGSQIVQHWPTMVRYKYSSSAAESPSRAPTASPVAFIV